MKQLLGGILLAAGILIAGASGLCSFWILFNPGSAGGTNFSILPLVLLIGGLPCALGVVLAFGGRTLIRRAAEERGNADDIADTFK